MRFGFYGDDFTGSVDVLLQLRRAGLECVLATSVEAADRLDGTQDMVGIAGVARSLPAADMRDEVLPALEWLRSRGADFVQYKACSTADSSEQVGSLGRALELGREVFGPVPVPVLLAQPDFGRYTFFGHHFARDGDTVYRLDRQPTMRSHPVTPSVESDLTLHLASQTGLAIRAATWPVLGDPQALSSHLDDDEAGAVVCDAFLDQHLESIGSALLASPHRPRFLLGSGGLTLALARALNAGNAPHPPLPSTLEPAAGPCLALSGSRSDRTRRQVDSARAAGWTVIDVRDADAVPRAVAAYASGAHTVLHSTDTGEPVAPGDLVDALADCGQQVLRSRPRTRLLLCGGDTSGHLLRALGVETLALRAAPWGNVVVCAAQAPALSTDPLDVVLKGGQMGHPDLFEDVRLGASPPLELPATSTVQQ